MVPILNIAKKGNFTRKIVPGKSQLPQCYHKGCKREAGWQSPMQSGRASSQGTQRASWRRKGKEQSAPEDYNSACILTLAFRFISGFWPPEHELANV